MKNGDLKDNIKTIANIRKLWWSEWLTIDMGIDDIFNKNLNNNYICYVSQSLHN